MNIFFSKVRSNTCITLEQERIEAAGVRLGFEIVDFEPFLLGSVWEKAENTISISKGDVVFVQFPTGFGEEFEAKLIDAIEEFEAVLVAIVCGNSICTTERYLESAESIIVTNNDALNSLLDNSVTRDKVIKRIIDSDSEEYIVQKVLLDAVEPYIDRCNRFRRMQELDKTRDVVHCAFALYDKDGSYSVYVGTVMLSLLQHTKSLICFHILHDEGLSVGNKHKLRKIAEDYGAIVDFQCIDIERLNIDNYWLKRYSIGSMYRCYLPDVLYYLPKVIYLDADLLVLKDIRELWDMDVEDYCLAGVHDVGFERGITLPSIVTKGVVKQSEYINSGMLVMNLDKIRSKGNLLKQSISFIENTPDTFLPDQDALNAIYAGEILQLDNCWNTYTKYAREEGKSVKEVIYHFMGERDINYSNPTDFDKLYLDIMQQTPWGYDAVVWRLYAGMASAFDKIDMLQKIVEQISGSDKKHIYIGKNTLAMNNVEKMIPLREGDYYVGDDMINSNGQRKGFPVKAIDAVGEEEKGKFVAFVLPEAENGTAMDRLNEMGYVNGEDYFVIPRFLVAKQGGYWR